nr:uncharacterized protein LOC123747864 [Procambarus clarkii]
MYEVYTVSYNECRGVGDDECRGVGDDECRGVGDDECRGVGDVSQDDEDDGVIIPLVDQLKLKPTIQVNINISGLLTNSGPRNYQVVKVLQQLTNRLIEVVDQDNNKSGHYLPHHAVMKVSVMTPIRIAFNCSAKLKADSMSLHDCLQTGPSLTQLLQDFLLRFRSGIFAYTANISKAFLSVGLQETDRDFTKFLWVKDPQDSNIDVITYKFASVLFGATSSLILLQATLDTHLKKSNSSYRAEISNNFQGATNVENKLVEIYHEANRELLGAFMPLQLWASNNKLN